MTIWQPSSPQSPSRAKALTALAASLLYHLCCPLMLCAAEQLTGGSGTAAPLLTGNQETISLTTAIFKTLGSLIIVIGLMLLLLFWVKKMGFTKGGARPEEGLITVLDSQMLAAKKQVSVLEVAGAYLVVGLSEQQITLLATLEPNERLMAASKKNCSPLPASFAAMLQKAAKGVSGLKQKQQGSAHAE